MNEKELSTDVNMTIYTGGEEWEKSKERVSEVWKDHIGSPDNALHLIPAPLFFRLTVDDVISNTFYHEYADLLKGKKVFPPDTDYTLENLLNGFKDPKQIKSLALAFKAYIKYDDEYAMIWFKDFGLLGYSTID